MHSTLPLGIDVSNHQGTIDWSLLQEAGIKFAFMKATESNNFIDKYFARNWENAKHYGISRGAYHFARPLTNQDARVEADFFYNVVVEQGIDTGDMLVLDMETEGNQDLSGWTLYWLQIIESYSGFKPLIYTSPAHITQLKLNTKPELGQFGLWLANWKNQFPEVPDPWDVIAFWQYTDSGRVPGIRTPVDLNRFNGLSINIPKYGKPAEIVEPEPDPEVNWEEIRQGLDTLADGLHRIKKEVEDLETLRGVLWNLLPPQE